jgi:hypothetical protein
MEQKKDFWCVKTERGEQGCEVQCEACIKRRAEPKTVDVHTVGKEKPEQVTVEAETQIAAQVVITLWKNGNFKLDGPLHDRILIRGLLSIALDQEGAIYRDTIQRVKLAEEARRKEPMWKRKLRQVTQNVRERNAQLKEERARAEAERQEKK